MKKILYLGAMLFITVLAFSQTKPDALREYKNSNFQRAVEICTQELGQDPSNIESYVVICWSLISLRNYSEAQRYASQALSLSPYNVRIIEILGEVAYYQGRNRESLQYFQQYINQAPRGDRIDRVYYLIGEIYIRQERYHHADIALTTAVHYVPRSADWWIRLAYAREKAQDYSAAITAYEQALSLNAQAVDARRGLDRTRELMGSN
jgi:tetratricopeptide (TPR) repeat protein